MPDVTLAGDPVAHAAELASLVAARLCHDLVSPLGAIGNGVELLEMSGDHPNLASSPELMLISDSVTAARARLQFFRAAFGHAPSDQRIAHGEVAQLCANFTSGTRLRIEMEGRGDLSRLEARIVLLGLLCIDSAMPWGGRVTVLRSEQGWQLAGRATRLRAQPELWALLGQDAALGSMPAPADVHFALLGLLSRASDRPIAWELVEGGAKISF